MELILLISKEPENKFKNFDDRVTSRMFGYTGVFDYYKNCSVIHILKDIKVKTLFISAIDDPFFGPDIIPHKEFKENYHISFSSYWKFRNIHNYKFSIKMSQLKDVWLIICLYIQEFISWYENRNMVRVIYSLNISWNGCIYFWLK